MKAIRIHEDGGPEVLQYEDAPDPEPGPGEVLIQLRAASLNRLDLWVRAGLPSVPKPRILGADGAGLDPEGRPRRHQPGDRARRPDQRRRRAHGRDARRARRGAGVERLPDSRRALVRGSRRVPARLRDRLPDAGHARRAGRGRVGARLGSRKRDRIVCGRDRESARRARGRNLVERREGRARPGPGRRCRRQPHDGRCCRGSEGGHRRSRRRTSWSSTSGEATWERSLQAVRPHGRIAVCGATTGPNPKAALHRVWWKQLTILGSTMGTKEDFEGAFELVKSGQGQAGRGLRLPALRGARRARAHGDRRALRQGRAVYSGVT